MSKGDKNGESEYYSKPNFDARLKYTDLLSDFVTDIRIAVLEDDIDLYMTTVENLFNLCYPYIRNKTELETEVDNLRKRTDYVVIQGTNNVEFLTLRNKLNKCYRKILLNAKDLFMPSGVEDEEGFDEDTFWKQAGFGGKIKTKPNEETD